MGKLDKDKLVAMLFLGLTVAFIFETFNNPKFFEWVFERHQNQWSWYIRPLFLLPFCLFAYFRTWSGVSVTIFCLFTSMFWFNPKQPVDLLNWLRYKRL